MELENIEFDEEFTKSEIANRFMCLQLSGNIFMKMAEILATVNKTHLEVMLIKQLLSKKEEGKK